MGGIEGQVSWLTECAVKEGKLDELKELMDEMVAATSEEEPGALNYEWFISEDGGTLHLYEKYADSAAMVTHANAFVERWVRRFMGCVDVKRFTAYGNPDEAAQKAMAPFGGKQLGTLGGFAR
jgi:quinol monooxygenase YgiN